jgi:prolyl-tRNA synthetase
MRLSKYIVPTLKEDPSDAVVMSHKLMTRAGLIRKESAGMYAYLPLGWRVLRKIIGIVREEMEAAGALECLMPELTNADLWKESGRWDTMGPEMIRIKDRNSMEYVLAPTHEEAFTALVRNLISSYRDLPINVFQINTKFRDEIRPRFGVIRSKEFIMKDAYSFDVGEAELEVSYQTMRKTYRRIFDRCGLDTIPVEADTGSMGGSNSEEFMVASEVGEEILLLCDGCGYRANQEKAEYQRGHADTTHVHELKIVDTPDVKTIDQLTDFFKCLAGVFMKSIIYIADGKPVMAVVPGDREVNEHKLKRALGAVELELAPDSVVEEVTKAPVGFAGPVSKLTIKTVFDLSIKNIKNGITGANKKDKHYTGVIPGRDFIIKEEYDITSAREHDPCPQCAKPMYVKKGIEVGHIFKLGYKYTKAMNVKVLDDHGKDVTPIMGCYGIGINRTMAAIVEQHSDDKGIVWPISVAPFDVHLVGIAKQDDEIKKIEEIYETLRTSGIDVFYDDRNVSPGFKFADADLIGIPVRITIGKTYFQKGEAEIKLRKDGKVYTVPKVTLVDEMKALLKGWDHTAC